MPSCHGPFHPFCHQHHQCPPPAHTLVHTQYTHTDSMHPCTHTEAPTLVHTHSTLTQAACTHAHIYTHSALIQTACTQAHTQKPAHVYTHTHTHSALRQHAPTPTHTQAHTCVYTHTHQRMQKGQSYCPTLVGPRRSPPTILTWVVDAVSWVSLRAAQGWGEGRSPCPWSPTLSCLPLSS